MAKQDKRDRKAVVDEIKKQQKSSERRRAGMIVAVCGVVALLIVAAAAYVPIKNWWDLRGFEELDLASIGEPASACGEITTEPAEGNQDHVEPGTDVDYDTAPPAFGTHWDTWDGFEKKFYTGGDRPELGMLVHNLEHGYTMIWYDETIADDAAAMDDLRGIASKFEGTDNLRAKVKVLPWTSEDGAAFPDDQHIAMTHWSAGGAGKTEPSEQVGVWQYCSAPSGEALDAFMTEYPYLDSPEPGAM